MEAVQIESVFDPEILDVDVSGVGSAGFLSIVFKLNGALIILVHSFQIEWCSYYPGEKGSYIGYILVVQGMFLPRSHSGGSHWP
jgi:hypothetical protein